MLPQTSTVRQNINSAIRLIYFSRLCVLSRSKKEPQFELNYQIFCVSILDENLKSLFLSGRVGVDVIPILKRKGSEDQIILELQYRPPMDALSLEFPSGSLLPAQLLLKQSH